MGCSRGKPQLWEHLVQGAQCLPVGWPPPVPASTAVTWNMSREAPSDVQCSCTAGSRTELTASTDELPLSIMMCVLSHQTLRVTCYTATDNQNVIGKTRIIILHGCVRIGKNVYKILLHLLVVIRTECLCKCAKTEWFFLITLLFIYLVYIHTHEGSVGSKGWLGGFSSLLPLRGSQPPNTTIRLGSKCL